MIDTHGTPAEALRLRWVVALLGAAAFTFESWVLGPYSWMYAYGGGIETLPAHLALHFGDRLFSPWAPFVAGGIDRFAFWGNADPFSWETLFLTLFPPWLANGLHRFVQYFIAIFFTAKVCQEQLGLESRAALLGGLLYACFSYFTFGEMLALPALPMFLWLVQRSRESARGPWLPLVVGLGFSTFTTFTHSVPYFAVFAGLWSAVALRDVSWRAAINLGLIVAGLAIGDSPQLLAVLANAPFSHREGFPPETVAWSLDGLFYRQLRFDYFNHDVVLQRIAWVLPLPVLTVGAILVASARFARFGSPALCDQYLLVYAVYFFLSQRWLFVSVQNLVGEWLPWVRGIYMGRFFDLPASFLIACQLAILVSIVHERIGPWRWAKRVLGTAVAVFVAFMLVQPKLFLFYRIGVDGWGQKNYEVKALDRLMSGETEPFRVASVLPLQPAYAYAQGLETVDGWANLYPKVYRQYWLQILAPLFRNAPGAKQIFDPESGRPQDHYIFLGADLAYPTVGAIPGEDPTRAVLEGFDVDRRFDLKLLGLHNVKYLLSEFPLKGRGLEAVHTPADPPRAPYSRDWATGRFLEPPSEPHGDGVLEKVKNAAADWAEGIRRKSRGKDLFIYRLADYSPRFRFVEEVDGERSGREVLDRLAGLPVSDLRRIAIAESVDLSGTGGLRFGRAEVRSATSRSSEITLKVSAASDAFLVAAITWNPRWRAEVDGKPVAVTRVNHVQMGINVPAGTQHIVLRYPAP